MADGYHSRLDYLKWGSLCRKGWLTQCCATSYTWLRNEKERERGRENEREDSEREAQRER